MANCMVLLIVASAACLSAAQVTAPAELRADEGGNHLRNTTVENQKTPGGLFKLLPKFHLPSFHLPQFHLPSLGGNAPNTTESGGGNLTEGTVPSSGQAGSSNTTVVNGHPGPEHVGTTDANHASGLHKGIVGTIVGVGKEAISDKIKFDEAVVNTAIKTAGDINNRVQGVVDNVSNDIAGKVGGSGKGIPGAIIGAAKGAISAHTKFDEGVADTVIKTAGDINHRVQGNIGKVTGVNGSTGGADGNQTLSDGFKATAEHINNSIQGLIHNAFGGTEDAIRKTVLGNMSSTVNKAVDAVISKFGGLGSLGGLVGNGALKSQIETAINNAVTEALDKFVKQLGSFNLKSLASNITSEVIKIIENSVKGGVEGALVGGLLGGIQSSGLGVAPKVNINFGGDDIPLGGKST